MLNKVIKIRTDFITLQQLLKIADVIQSGGQAKYFLASNKVVINGVNDNRRGRKLRNGDVVVINDNLSLTLTNN